MNGASKNSQTHPGVSPVPPVTSLSTSLQPLPRPLGLPPYHYSLAAHCPELAAKIEHAGKMVFHVLGDSGGIQDGRFQNFVAARMIADLSPGYEEAPAFCYHVGDVVYTTGRRVNYYEQFYRPYFHYPAPIFSIPGNHDGELKESTLGHTLEGWTACFMQPVPVVDPISQDAPRQGLNLPNVYWTLVTPFAVIVGLYTNVPEHGSIDSLQQQWLNHEFATAPRDRALILALHHPIYSFDDGHGGSSRMADVLENAIRETGRVPNLVLSGHVHAYQRIEQTIAPDVATPFDCHGQRRLSQSPPYLRGTRRRGLGYRCGLAAQRRGLLGISEADGGRGNHHRWHG
ncbi:MAG: metallophosphoesterase [Chthoniobacteraceae bacterium]